MLYADDLVLIDVKEEDLFEEYYAPLLQKCVCEILLLVQFAWKLADMNVYPVN